MSKIVIIPTYNEKENIGLMIQSIFDLNKGYHILVIDDNSSDGTADIVKQAQSTYPNSLFLIQRPGKLGLGTAYIRGFEWSLEKGYQFIFEMDADFSHDPHDLERLFQACSEKGVDVAVGSRYVLGGEIENWPLSRKLISKGGALYSRFFTGIPVKDPTAGFVCYKQKVLASMNLNQIKFIGYAFQIEMKFAAWKLGFAIQEVPIVFKDRKFGASKMTKGIIQEGVKGVVSMQYQALFGGYINRIRKSN